LALFHTYLDNDNQKTRYHEIGLAPSAVYEIYPFRTTSVQYSFSKAIPVGGTTSLDGFNVYNRSAVSATWTIGWLNNYLNPRRGWILRPTTEIAGVGIATSFAYVKGSLEGTAYLPLTRGTNVVFSASAGRLRPAGASRFQSDPEIEYRFDPVRYYAGGATDVRGWGLNALGPRVARADSVFLDAQGVAQATNPRWEAIGGLGKVRASLAVNVPFPGLGESWKIGTFVDMGVIAARLVTDALGRAQMDANDQPLISDRRFPAFTDARFGAGAGIRYRTPVGSVRLDLAFKLNPSGTDLQSADQSVLFREDLRSDPPDEPFRRRFNVHLSIDRAF
jgi:outer membrane protein insertion porin family